MHKILILALGLALTAASCNFITEPLGFDSGPKGVLKSQDSGQSYAAANSLEKKGSIGNVTANIIAVDPGQPEIVYMGSSNGIYKTADGALTWKYVLNGIRIGDVVVDPNDSDLIYAAGISSNNGKVIKSTDGGSSWSEIYHEPAKNNAVLTLAISPANSKILLAGLNNGEIIRSTDQGSTWQVITDLNDPVIQLRYANSFTVFALARTLGIQVSADQGSNWAAVPLGVQASGNQIVGSRTQTVYNDMAIDPKLPSVIFAATDAGLYRTIDRGASWVLMNMPLTDSALKASAVAVSPINSNTIYAAIGSTVFKTVNGGLTWETKNLPTTQRVRQILINPQSPSIIYLGMGERS